MNAQIIPVMLKLAEAIGKHSDEEIAQARTNYLAMLAPQATQLRRMKRNLRRTPANFANFSAEQVAEQAAKDERQIAEYRAEVMAYMRNVNRAKQALTQRAAQANVSREMVGA